MTIRAPAIDDVPAILACYDAAILEKAAGAYARPVLDNWRAQDKPSAVREYKAIIDDPDWIKLVYEQDGDIYGFATVHASEQKLAALYARRGGNAPVGSLLLAAMRAECSARRIPHLDFDATVNAQGFYIRHGARESFRAAHDYGDDRPRMPYIRMRLAIGG